VHLQNRKPTEDDESRLPPPSRISRPQLRSQLSESKKRRQLPSAKTSINDTISDFFENNQKFEYMKIFFKIRIINNITKNFYVLKKFEHVDNFTFI
jgi:hypothetical protein